MDAATAGMVGHAIALAAGIGIGLGAGWLLFPAIREAKVLRAQLDTARKEHEEYKASVDAHFRKTADLVGQMTRSYAAVYDHLAVGARTFCDDAAAGSKVGFGPLPGTLASPDIDATAESDGATAASDGATAAGDGATTGSDGGTAMADAALESAQGNVGEGAAESSDAAQDQQRKGDRPA